MQGRTIRTPKKREAFLAAIAAGRSIAAACQAAGIARSAAYRWRDEDGEFAVAWDEALEVGTERLEDEAVRRALDGSDTMLIFLLKARKPQMYREPRMAGMAALAPEDLKAIEEARRRREMTVAELEAELQDLDRRKAAVDQARSAGLRGKW